MSTVMQAAIPHDRPDQLQQVQSGLLQGETLYCVYDDKGIGTGYVALTDLRVIFQNKSLLPEFPAHHNKTAIISVPYSQIASVSILFDKSWLGSWFSSSVLHINTTGGRNYVCQLRATDRARHLHDTILWKITPHETGT
jgi:hypothetical protein